MLYKNSFALAIIFSSQLALSMQHRNLPFIPLEATNDRGEHVCLFIPLELWHRIIAINGYEPSFKRVSKLFSLISRIRADENIINRINTFLLKSRIPNRQLAPQASSAASLLQDCEDGNIPQVIAALDAGCSSVVLSNPRKPSLLHIAAEAGQIELIKGLLARGISINALDAEGSTPLTYAIMAHSSAAIEALIDLGADVELATRYMTSKLSLDMLREIGIKNITWIQILLKLGVAVTHDMIEHALRIGDPAISNLLLNAPPKEVTKQDAHELVSLIQNGAIYKVLMPKKKLLISKDALAKQPQHTTALPIITPPNMPPMQNVLTVSPHRSNRICWSDNVPTVASAPSSIPLLHVVAEQGNLEQIMRLISQQRISVNLRDVTGSTPLTYAICGKSLDAVKLLHSLGADLNNVDSLFGTTPLYDAIRSKNLPIIQYLGNNGANLAHIRKTDDTLLHTAVETGDHPIVSYILEKKIIAINDISGFNETALSIACQRGFYDIAELLIAHGADVHLRIEKKSPCDIAYAKQHYNIVTLLLRHNASHTINIPDFAMLHAITLQNVAWVEALIALKVPVTEHMIEQALHIGNEGITELLCNAVVKS
jgi:uncharacterized protein